MRERDPRSPAAGGNGRPLSGRRRQSDGDERVEAGRGAKPTPQGGVKEGVPRSEAVAMTL
jgi:hypothetical protein